MAIVSKVYLGLPASPSELLSNGDFELQTGDDFDSWTEEIPAFTELLSNEDFELQTGDDFDDWVEIEAGTGTIEDETVEVHGDSHSAKLTGVDFANYAWIYQSFSSTVGKTYRLAVWVKGTYKVGYSGGGAVTWEDEKTSADWEQYVTYYIATNTTSYLNIRAHENNIVYVDDASVSEYTGNIELSDDEYEGNDAVKITSAHTNTQPYIYQTVTSDPGDYHRVSFWSKGDGTDGVVYQVYDVTNSAVIASGYGTTDTDYTETVVNYYVPASCVSLKLTFTGNEDAIVYIDDASILEYGPDTWTENEHVMSTPAPSWGYGLTGKDPLRGVANTGTANLVFDNQDGYYSPESSNRIAGFEEGMDIKITTSLDADILISAALLTNGGME